MKKWLALFAVLFMVRAAAAEVPEFGDWRSTETCTADSNVLVATGAIFLDELSVSSGNTGSTFRYFNSTTTDLTITRSTSVLYQTGTTGSDWWLKETLDDGFLYTTVGTSCIRARWQWISYAPDGQNDRGRK